MDWGDEAWERERPPILSARNFGLALALHLLVFVLFFAVAFVQGLFAPRETVVPIDLTLVVNENLDGVDDEPPPLQNPTKDEPPPPPPAPKPIREERKREEPRKEPPKVEEPLVEEPKVDMKKREEERKKAEEAKKRKAEEDRKKAEADRKKAEAERKKAEAEKKRKREERLERMRKSATKNTNTKPVKIETRGPSGNGRTGRQTLSEAEIRKRLEEGYRPGREESLATSDLQLGVSLIQMALNEKWDALAPKVGASGTVFLSCRINSAGGLMAVKLERSCGDRLSDEAALAVARQVTHIRALPAAFKARFSKETLTIRYEVKGL